MDRNLAAIACHSCAIACGTTGLSHPDPHQGGSDLGADLQGAGPCSRVFAFRPLPWPLLATVSSLSLFRLVATVNKIQTSPRRTDA